MVSITPLDDPLDFLNGRRVDQRGHISSRRAGVNAADHTAHDLRAASLRQLGHDKDGARRERSAEPFLDTRCGYRADVVCWAYTGDKGNERLALDRVIRTDHGRFDDPVNFDQYLFDF